MRALAIDTSTDIAGVALCDGPTCVARTPIEAHLQSHSDSTSTVLPGQHAERLLGLIEDAMTRAAWKKSDLELVACCIGPGSFTGVRVGVATAKGIALGLGIPIVGIGSLEAMAQAHLFGRAGPADPDRAIVPLLDARKGEVFWAAYSEDGALLAGPGHLAATRAADLAELIPRSKLIFLGDVARSLALGAARVVRAPASDRPDPAEIARLALAKHAARGPDDLDALEPSYVRPPDITLPSGSP